MKIDVRVTVLESFKMKGLANVTIDNVLKINGIMIMEGRNGLFIQLPTRKNKKGEWIPYISFEKGAKEKQELSDKIIKEYKRLAPVKETNVNDVDLEEDLF